MSDQNYQATVIIVGAGPGGLAVGAALKDLGIKDVVLLEKGGIGQAWQDYPSETHLLSESVEYKDENMISDVPTSEVFPNIPHPSHTMYQRYLEYVALIKGLDVRGNTLVEKVQFDQTEKQFVIETTQGAYRSKILVWATGMYSTPDEKLDCEGSYVHYAKVPDYGAIEDNQVTVIGAGNGASGVVMELAKPGRLVTMITSRPYEVPLPIDCLWKENMEFVKNLENQGLVKIIENFRVKKVEHGEDGYCVYGPEDQVVVVPNKPIACVGFLPNIAPIAELVDQKEVGHDVLLDLDSIHQSRRQPGLYIGGTIGKKDPEEGFIRHFREYGKVIAASIAQDLMHPEETE